MSKGILQIDGRKIGPGFPVYVIAELSANHNGSFDDAVQLIHAAKDAGADAIKLQTYTADTLTIDSDKSYFQISGGTLWDGKTLYDLYGEAYTPWEWQPRLKAIADQIGISLFSSPFDGEAVSFLEKMNVPAYKIASFEIVDLPLIRRVAKTGKPLILSTGMASLGEIREAVEAARGEGANEIALLKCTSAYPAPPESMNLSSMSFLRDEFGLVSGLSDHTLGIAVPVAAVALGACLIEKHFTLSRKNPGPDSAFSLEPKEFREMVDAIRMVEKAVGEPRFGVNPDEEKSRVFRRSLFAVRDIRQGEPLTFENIRSIRPGYGLPPKHLPEILGRKVTRNIERGTPLSWDLLEN